VSWSRLAGLPVLAALLWFAGMQLQRPPPLPRPTLCLTVLDVGQGDALLLSFSGQRHWLVDGGGVAGGGYDVGRHRLLPMLRRLGVERLDKVFVTHPHADHFEGLFAVIESIDCDELWLHERRELGPRMRALVRLASRRGVRIREASTGAQPGPGPAPIESELLYPWPGVRQALGPGDSDANNHSLVLRLALGKVSFLLTGDIESPAEDLLLQRGAALRSTVLKVPHHASNTSSTPGFVERVDPLIAVAGIGADNRFGFPHASVTARYLGRGTPLYWTGRQGPMRLCTGGYSLRLERLSERGAPTVLRTWDAQALARWSRAGDELTERPPLQDLQACPAAAGKTRQRPGGKGHTKRPKGNKDHRRARAHGARKARSEAAAANKQRRAEEREWQRRRKARKRLRAPWR